MKHISEERFIPRIGGEGGPEGGQGGRGPGGELVISQGSWTDPQSRC